MVAAGHATDAMLSRAVARSRLQLCYATSQCPTICQMQAALLQQTYALLYGLTAQVQVCEPRQCAQHTIQLGLRPVACCRIRAARQLAACRSARSSGSSGDGGRTASNADGLEIAGGLHLIAQLHMGQVQSCEGCELRQAACKSAHLLCACMLNRKQG